MWRRRYDAFAKNKEGATAVEFAMIALPFFILIFGLMEIAVLFLFSTALDNGTAEASRMIRTGQMQLNDDEITATDFRQEVCDNLFGLVECDNKVRVDVRVFASFTDSMLGETSPQNEDGEVDDNNLTFAMGGPNDIVMVRTFYEYQLFTPVLTAPLADMPNGRRLLVSTVVFRNEPY